MDRLYGNFRCDVCQRPSDFGWVYTCTQDDYLTGKRTSQLSSGLIKQLGELNILGNGMKYGSSKPEHLEEEELTFRMPTAELSHSVEKGIRAGQYSPEQVAILRAQKQHVVDMAKEAIERFEQSLNPTDLSPQIDSTSQSVDSNPHLPFPIMQEIQEIPAADYDEKPSATPKFRLYPQCSFRACQLCRPTYRDRTWQHFEDIFAMQPPGPIQAIKNANRPFASASIMRKIGLRSAPRRPALRPSNSRALYEFDDEGKIVFKNRSYRTSQDIGGSRDVVDANAQVEPESRGFRESMKRTFRSMLAHRQNSSRSGRKRKTRESSTSDEDAAEFDMGLWKELNDELLNEASSVPLPVKDSMDTLNAQVNRTDVGGVAVTEEAADLGAADIIMSV